MIVIAATTNNGKMKELKRILAPFNITVISMVDAGITVDIVEDGETFSENALIKAKAIHNITGKAVIADDSGLCVNCLDGAPGVYSARYCGEKTSYDHKIEMLLEEISCTGSEDRTAYFASAVAFVNTDSTEHIFMGKCVGEIGMEPKGINGFGYDPIFYIGQRSFAELDNEEKDAISHRGQALNKFVNALPEIIHN